MIRGASKLRSWAGERLRRGPKLTLKLVGVRVDRDRLAAYNRVCRFRCATAAATTRTSWHSRCTSRLMTDEALPVPGARHGPHRPNEIVQHRRSG